MRTEWRLYQASEWETGKRPYYPLLDPDADRNIDEWTLLKTRSDSRKVFVNYGPLKTAVYEKARYAVGDSWLPVFTGADSDFGKAAGSWLQKIWFQTGNLVGPTRNWWESLQIESRYLDVFGEIFVYKVIDKDRFPRYQHIPPHRVDNPRASGTISSSDGTIAKGPYKGCRCVYGVVLSDFGAPLAYHVLGNTPAKDRFFPASQMIHVGNWEFVDQTRPLPSIAHGILDLRDSRSVIDNEKRFLEAASSIAILEQNTIGGVDVNDPTQFVRLDPGIAGSVGGGGEEQPAQPQSPGYQTQSPLRPTIFKDNGEYKYFKAGTGSSVQAFQFQRPSGEVTAFLDRLGRNALNFVWPYDLTNSPQGPGPSIRSLWTRANNLCKERQNKLYPGAKQRVLFAIATAIELGILPDSDDWMEWDLTMPKKPSIDAGRDAAADLNDIRMGVQSWSDVLGSLGTDILTVANRKAMDIAEMFLAKKRAEDYYFAQTGETIVLPDDYMFCLTPNGSNNLDPMATVAGQDIALNHPELVDAVADANDKDAAEDDEDGGDGEQTEDAPEDEEQEEMAGSVT